MRKTYNPLLSQIYHDTYFYDKYSKVYNDWDGDYLFGEILKKYPAMIVYTDKVDFEKILYSEISGLNKQNITKIKRVFFNEDTRESLFEICYDTINNNTFTYYSSNADNIDSSGKY